MTIWGKIIGGAAGLALGGPVGGLVGLLLGTAVDETISRSDADNRENRRKVIFSIGIIALAAKMAKADGRVSAEEIQAFKQVFRIPAGEEKNVARLFNLAREHVAGYDAYARQIADVMRGNSAVLMDVLEALFFIAEADGDVHPNELNYIRSVAEIFGFSKTTIEDLVERHVGPDPSSPYTVLGVRPDISDAALKARYRQLVRENHPDRMIAEGVPSDLLAVATRRLATINTAYDTIMASRGDHGGAGG